MAVLFQLVSYCIVFKCGFKQKCQITVIYFISTQNFVYQRTNRNVLQKNPKWQSVFQIGSGLSLKCCEIDLLFYSCGLLEVNSWYSMKLATVTIKWRKDYNKIRAEVAVF